MIATSRSRNHEEHSAAWQSRRVMVFNGQADTHISTGDDYDTLTLGEVFALKPADKGKRQAPACIPSSYCSYDARAHAVQQDRGSYVALTGDIDKGDLPLPVVEAAVTTIIGASAYFIYASSNARPGNMRWRIIVPLSEPCDFEAWHDAQTALFDLLDAEGLKMDRALARAGQPVFLPNTPAVHADSGEPLRGEFNEPLYYACRSRIDAEGHDITQGPIGAAIEVLRAQRRADDALREQMQREAQRKRQARASNDDESVIDAFDKANSIADLLQDYRYEQSPRKPQDWRSPHQTGDTYATRIMGDRWFSLSQSDADAGLGAKHAAGCYGDAYDLFVHYEHGGNHKAAFGALYAERKRESAQAYAQTADRGHHEAEVIDFPSSASAQSTNSAKDDTEAQGQEEQPSEERPAQPKRPWGVKLDDFRAYMPTHQYIFAPAGEIWPASSVNSRIAPVPLFDGKGAPVVDKKGDQVELPANQWLDKFKPVEQMTWSPGDPQVIPDKLVSEGGWIDRPGCHVFNLYRPPAAQKGSDPAKASRWIDHVRRIYPDDADHMIAWLAHRVQRPDEKVNHALVMGGSQGIGKDTVLEPVKVAIGPWNFADVRPEHVTGRFNGFVKSVILRVSEARDLGDSGVKDRFSFYEHMKIYTAAPPDVLRVDEKNLREYAVFNVCGVIITTNHKTDGIYLPSDDRRHYVAWSNSLKEEFSDEYWDGMYRWLRDEGGNEHVAAYLRGLSLDSFNAKAPPPKTTAFWDIVSSNQAPEEAELEDAIDALGRPHALTINQIANCASEEFAEWLRDRKNSRAIPHKLDSAGYTAVHNEGSKDGCFVIGLKRCRVYAKRELSRRDAVFAAQQLAGNR